jgi:uncharacterized protein YndB with AHSA1/START domain
MPIQKDFKRLVRGRMQKTGESYTAARAHLLKTKPKTKPAAATAVSVSDYARLGGKSDAILKARTGCTWERWVNALDYAKAYEWPHREIARHVMEKYKIPGWWAQTVTVGYERIKGKRAIGQRMNGFFEASKSKTFPVPVSRLYRAFTDGELRGQWLTGVELAVRTATRDKSVTITWPDRTSVTAWFERKGTDKSVVSLAHQKLPDQAAATQAKAFWGERLEKLKVILAE